MKVLKYGNINDMPRGWVTGKYQPKWHHVIYDMWKDMWRRIYTDIHWFGCQIQHDYKYLSNYVNDIMKLDNFDLFKENPNGWSIDKDIKIPGNRDYYFEALSLVSISSNASELMTNRNPMNKSCHRNKLSKIKSKPIIGFNKSSVLLFLSAKDANKNFDMSAIGRVCKGIHSTHKGYKWRYINYKHNKRLRVNYKHNKYHR